MAKQPYFSERFTLATGRQKNIPVHGKWVTILYNSVAENPEISIDGSSFSEIPAGISVELQEPFKRIEFKNPATGSMELWVAFSDEKIHDNRAVIASLGKEQMPVIDRSNLAWPIDPPTVALPLSFLIDAAAAVDKGGGKVGIPVTTQPFENDEYVVITGTTNYNGNYQVDSSSTANEVVITATYAAETFDGTDDRIGLLVPRNIETFAGTKEVIMYNNHGSESVWFAGQYGAYDYLNPAEYRGQPIASGTHFIITYGGYNQVGNLCKVYFVAPDAAGKSGITVSVMLMASN
jgi:hypothetical protein